MTDCGKTIVINQDKTTRDWGICPVCGGKMQPVVYNSGMVRCPVCGFVKKNVLELMPGTVIGNKYKLLTPIGSGGCGDIFLCYPLERPELRYVAKSMRDIGSDTARHRFAREAKTLQRIHDPRIVKILDHWNEEDASFIILEYVNGKNLRNLRKEFVFDEKAVLIVGLEVVGALRSVWEQSSIIHRDIKPENIMLDEEQCIKLLDFGLCKNIDSNETELTLEHSGLGTPGFMSPEQFKDFKHADFRSDIFSVGATLCFLLTGVPPFHGDDLSKLYQNTIKNSPPPESVFQNLCSAECTALIRRMMAKNPEDRPGDYQVLEQELQWLYDRLP